MNKIYTRYISYCIAITCGYQPQTIIYANYTSIIVINDCYPARCDGGQHGLYVGKISLICEDYSSYITVKSFIYSPTHEQWV